jgi:hypothetical protein
MRKPCLATFLSLKSVRVRCVSWLNVCSHIATQVLTLLCIVYVCVCGWYSRLCLYPTSYALALCVCYVCISSIGISRLHCNIGLLVVWVRCSMRYVFVCWLMCENLVVSVSPTQHFVVSLVHTCVRHSNAVVSQSNRVYVFTCVCVCVCVFPFAGPHSSRYRLCTNRTSVIWREVCGLLHARNRSPSSFPVGSRSKKKRHARQTPFSTSPHWTIFFVRH